MRLTGISPFVPCTRLDQQVGFCWGILGFELRLQEDNFAYLRRDSAAIRLIEVAPGVDLSLPEPA